MVRCCGPRGRGGARRLRPGSLLGPCGHRAGCSHLRLEVDNAGHLVVDDAQHFMCAQSTKGRTRTPLSLTAETTPIGRTGGKTPPWPEGLTRSPTCSMAVGPG